MGCSKWFAHRNLDLLPCIHDRSQVLWSLANTWRSSFASTAMEVLNAFFDSNDEYKESDEARRAFAKDQLEGYKFLYGKTITIQNKVPPFFFFISPDSKPNVSQRVKPVFWGSLILKTFARHFDLIKDSQWATGFVHTCKTNKPRGALVLSCVAVRPCLHRIEDVSSIQCSRSGPTRFHSVVLGIGLHS